MVGADTCVCRNIRVRLQGHLKAYGVGGTTNMGRCKSVSWRGEGGEASMGGRVFDAVVTSYDLCRLVMTLLRINTLLLLCQG